MAKRKRKNAVNVNDLLKSKELSPAARARLEALKAELGEVETAEKKATTPAQRKTATKRKRSLLSRVKALFSRKKKKTSAAPKTPLKSRAKAATHKATGWLLNGKKKKTTQASGRKKAKKKNKTVIVKPKRVTVINGKKKGAKKRATKRPVGKKPTKRRNLDHPDRTHQVQVSKHWRAGGASGWQRAAAAGQKDLFAHGIRKRNGQKKTTRSSPKRRNSEASAAELYEMFQGRAPQRDLRVEGDTSMPATAATLGLLIELKLENGQTLKFTRMDGVYLAAAKVRGHDRLFIVGNYEAERPAGITQPIHVSRVKSVTYETRKAHIGDGKTYQFEHTFGEEGGERPWLTIDPSGKLHFTGGSYFLRREGVRD